MLKRQSETFLTNAKSIPARMTSAAAKANASVRAHVKAQPERAGMGATLNIAVGMGAYTLSDAASWSQFGNRGTHAVLLQGDPALINPYSVIPVSATRCPRINAQGAAALLAWLTGAGGQAAIAAFAPGGTALIEPTTR